MNRKTNILITLVFIATSFLTHAQTKSEKKQVKKFLKEGQVHFYVEDYFKAWQSYSKVLRIDKKNEIAAVNGAISMFKLKYSLDSAVNITPVLVTSKLPDAGYFLAKIRHQQRSFDEAITLLTEYNKLAVGKRLYGVEETDYLIQVCRNAKMFIANPNRSIIKNLGAGVNSPFSDYVPVILPDESALYFTSRRTGSSNNKKDETGKFYEDVYVSYRQNNEYHQAQNVGNPINTETNDACVAISPDGKRIIIYRTSADELTGDLYMTKQSADNKWSDPEKIGNEINSQYIETSACFSNDTSEIYFSSNRPGGFGGKDLYRIKKTPNGQWAQPYNLGPTINTSRDDDAPFLHPDGVTLYFSSQGHNTIGEFDVFKSVLDQTNNQFAEAENLGYPINDVGNDIFFVMNADGQRGYYSSIKKETFGGNDIYQIDTRFGENDLTVKKGKVLIDEIPGRAKITVIDKESKEVNGNYYSDPNTGKFILVMNPLKSYQAIVEAEGYKDLVIDIRPIVSEKTNQDLELKIEKK